MSKAMHNHLSYGARLIAVYLLSLPSACLILFYASGLQAGSQDRNYPSFSGQGTPVLFAWEMNLLVLCGPLCSLFLCSYALLHLPAAQHKNGVASKPACREHAIWCTSFILNLFLIILFSLYAQGMLNF